jgi:hypothetical protein
VFSLPWNDGQNPPIDLKRAKAALDANHYGLDSVKERMIEFLAVHKLNGSRQGSVLCFVGPPGVGKTSVAHTIADVLGRPVVNIALGGLKDEAEIRGHRRTYVGSRMGKIMNAIRTAGAKNPVCILDEIDKMHDGAQGDPASALLEVLDAEQNGPFDNVGPYKVPAGHYFMMGDNRDNSTDSRALWGVGYVPLENFVGRAEIIFFSAAFDDPDAFRLLAPWRWPLDIRWSRFFQLVR